MCLSFSWNQQVALAYPSHFYGKSTVYKSSCLSTFEDSTCVRKLTSLSPKQVGWPIPWWRLVHGGRARQNYMADNMDREMSEELGPVVQCITYVLTDSCEVKGLQMAFCLIISIIRYKAEQAEKNQAMSMCDHRGTKDSQYRKFRSSMKFKEKEVAHILNYCPEIFLLF